MNLGTMQDPAKLVDAFIPLARMKRTAAIPAMVAFLAGDGANHLTTTASFAEGGIMQGL
jgi:hypothetical protein